MGYYYRHYVEKKIHFAYWKILLCVALIQACYLMIKNHNLSIAVRNMNLLTVPTFFMPIITALSATICLLCLSKMLSPLLKNNRAIKWIGGNTRHIMYHHQLCFVLLNCAYAYVFNAFRPDFLNTFKPNVFHTSAWYTYPLSDMPFGTLPYILAGIFLPLITATLIARIPKRAPRYLAWGGVYLAVLILLSVMGRVFTREGLFL